MRRLSHAASDAAAAPSLLAPIVRDVLEFLIGEALPHLQAEGEILYPALEQALDRPDAVADLEAGHAAIRLRTERLDSLVEHLAGRAERRAACRLLEELDRLVHDHLRRAASLWAEARSAQPELDAGAEALGRRLREAERQARGTIVLVVRRPLGSQEAVALRHNPDADRVHAVTLADIDRRPSG